MQKELYLQRAIDYMEEHLSGELDFGEAANQAGTSRYDFQRTFSLLFGCSPADYVRCRRLSLAAEELRNGMSSVTEAAFHYGFESPEAFSRAFRSFHGIRPTEAKHGGQVKAFARLSVSLLYVGGKAVPFRIKECGALNVICRRTRIALPRSSADAVEVMDIWKHWQEDGSAVMLRSLIPKHVPDGLWGIVFSLNQEAGQVPFGFGTVYSGGQSGKMDFEMLTIPPQTYAVFKCQGGLRDGFHNLFRSIESDFFTADSPYYYNNAISIVKFSSESEISMKSPCEIWISVEKKKRT